MVIVVDTRFLLNNHEEGYAYFIYENFRHIVSTNPDHDFIFVFDRLYETNFLLGKNIKTAIVSPVASGPLFWKFWYDVRIPALLKKHKADVFVATSDICSLTTRIPQCLLLHDLSFLHSPFFGKKSHATFYKRYTQKFLNKVRSIVVPSSFSKQTITQHYEVDLKKLVVMPYAVNDMFRTVDDAERSEIKNKLTGGKEYFVNTAIIHPRENLVNLLKAFSIFKKRQASNWKLVFTGKPGAAYKDFTEGLKTYKYRSDVVLAGDLTEKEKSRILGSAYALVHPSFDKDFAMPVLEAMRSNVPVITSNDSSMQEMAQDAALNCNPEQQNDIAEKMMLLYKDENLRQRLIEKGRTIAEQYDWKKSSDALWQGIVNAVG